MCSELAMLTILASRGTLLRVDRLRAPLATSWSSDALKKPHMFAFDEPAPPPSVAKFSARPLKLVRALKQSKPSETGLSTNKPDRRRGQRVQALGRRQQARRRERQVHDHGGQNESREPPHRGVPYLLQINVLAARGQTLRRMRLGLLLVVPSHARRHLHEGRARRDDAADYVPALSGAARPAT